MSHEFGSLGDLALHFAQLQVSALAELQKGLKKAATVVQNEAKASIGEYQDAVGPFPAWEPLSDATEREKAAKGYPVDAPLLRTGEMRDSIVKEVSGLEAVIGSLDDKMLYHEFGTAHIPPRPVLGPAVFKKREKIQKILGAAGVAALVGGDQVHAALKGYDYQIEGEKS
jgi:HK97 gp10 family phage protein